MSQIPLKEIKKLDWSGRKYRTAWKLTILFSIMLVVPIIVSFICALLGVSVAFTILPVEYFVPLVGLLWGAYFGANVMEKRSIFNPDSKLQSVAEVNKVPDGSGGQPAGTDNP
jgi:hypothetical protein